MNRKIEVSSTPTDNERRKIAKKLRELTEEYDFVVCLSGKSYLDLVSDERFIGGNVYTSESVAHLADILEPEGASCDN